VSQDQQTAEHLFISYAMEDWPLAEWLARRLTAEGYRVWCDRFQLLGGESYPKEIDVAIKTRAFRVLALLSKASLNKPNPRKERTLALNIAREREIDFLIPLNVDGLRPTELDWMTNDLTFIPFRPSWADGLRDLLRKLESINAPRPLANGRQIASETFVPAALLTGSPEAVFTNHLPFRQLPTTILQFALSSPMTPLEQQVVTEGWAYHAVSPTVVFSLTSPPGYLLGSDRAALAERISWRTTETSAGIDTSDVISALLHKTVVVEYLRRGLKASPDHRLVYFPPGLLPNDKLFFSGYDERQTWLLATGERTYRRGGDVQRYRYHLSPRFRVRRDLSSNFVLQISPGLYLTDLAGDELPPRARNSRRKQLCRSWWNHEWLNRHLAVVCFLADGKEAVVFGEAPEEQTVLAGRLNAGAVPFGIDEAAVEDWRARFSIPFDEGGAAEDVDEPGDGKDDDDDR
jgi:hypothetical protein